MTFKGRVEGSEEMYREYIPGHQCSGWRDQQVQKSWGINMFSTSEERYEDQSAWYGVREIVVRDEAEELKGWAGAVAQVRRGLGGITVNSLTLTVRMSESVSR